MHQGVIGCINQHERHINLQQENKAEINDQTPLIQGSNSLPAMSLKQREEGHCSVCCKGGLRVPCLPGQRHKSEARSRGSLAGGRRSKAPGILDDPHALRE